MTKELTQLGDGSGSLEVLDRLLCALRHDIASELNQVAETVDSAREKRSFMEFLGDSGVV